jgi:exosortase
VLIASPVTATPGTHLPGLLLSISSLLLYSIGLAAEIVTIQSYSLILFIAGSVLYLFGKSQTKRMLFPIVFLVFMVPIPAQIYTTLTVPLQLLVSQISAFLAASVSIPIYREGNILYLSEMTLQVVQACSGLRSMMALLMLCAIFGYFSFRSISTRLILLLFAIPIAIFVNILRVVSMIIGHQYFNIDLTHGFLHEILGIFVFISALIAIALVTKGLQTWKNHSTVAS